MLFHKLLALFLCSLKLTDGYSIYRDRIPNGDRLPHPCKPNFIWEGVGHKNARGGGERNPFGLDFAKNEFKWNECLCKHDSDGDGKTNGEELGDPDCVWTVGDIPPKLNGLSHPGVCEPFDDPKCQKLNDWSFCDYKEFKCDAVNRTSVQQFDITFPEVSVPPKETTYWCMNFELPSNDAYHIIAFEPLIDNKNVLHHILLYGCDTSDGDDSWKITQPESCEMAGSTCRNLIAAWTVGSEGSCLSDEYGFRVGANSTTTVLMQIHYNNPEMSRDFKDGSGIRIHLDSELRNSDGAMLMIGTNYLEIPPATVSTVQEGACHATCTRNLPYNIYLDSVLLHMHYLGVAGSVHMTRDGEEVALVQEDNYSYDRPATYNFQEKLVFKPGDELRLVCNFKSISKDTWTYFGDATSDEMCFAFFIYYPAIPQFTTCTTYKGLGICDNSDPKDVQVANCNFTALLQVENLYPLYLQLVGACNSTDSECPIGCPETVEVIRNSSGCLQPPVAEITEIDLIVKQYGEIGILFVKLLHKCEPDWDSGKIDRFLERRGRWDDDSSDEDDNNTIDKGDEGNNTTDKGDEGDKGDEVDKGSEGDGGNIVLDGQCPFTVSGASFTISITWLYGGMLVMALKWF